MSEICEEAPQLHQYVSSSLLLLRAETLTLIRTAGAYIYDPLNFEKKQIKMA
jgi:hypothetical protein